MSPVSFGECPMDVGTLWGRGTSHSRAMPCLRGPWGSHVSSLLPLLPEVPSPVPRLQQGWGFGRNVARSPGQESLWLLLKWVVPCHVPEPRAQSFGQEFMLQSLKLPRKMIAVEIWVSVLGGEHLQSLRGGGMEEKCLARLQHPLCASCAFQFRIAAYSHGVCKRT